MEARDESGKPMDDILLALQERAKELNCLYRVDEILVRHEASPEDAYREILAAIPPGWQYPLLCRARLILDGKRYEPASWEDSPWSMSADIVLEGEKIGELTVAYTERCPPADEGPFLKEERRLINAIVERIGYAVMQRRLKRAVTNWKAAIAEDGRPERRGVGMILTFLRATDARLLLRITRRMINHLSVMGNREAAELLSSEAWTAEADQAMDNRPLERRLPQDYAELTDEAFRIASEHLSEEEIVACIEGWIREDKSAFLYEALEDLGTTLSELGDAILRYRALNLGDDATPLAVRTGLRVALLRRFFTDRLEFITHAKDFVRVSDFYDLAQHTVYPARSHGKLGGKSAGLFLASNIVRKSPEYDSLLADVRVPKTWYVTSDTLLEFIRHNKLQEVYDRKYRPIEQIRFEYPHLVQVFKNSPFPAEIEHGLSMALDDFEGRPIVVRSSSLLEDQSGAAFSGKYKSLFLANQGTKKERLDALQDAIAEIYASVFGPDPIEYRIERGLLDVHEEMGIMIQEVVGRRIGPYFLPSFSGVAFSRNDFRWSARIKREDGLLRLVMGLGTRAVDRVADDYPVLVAPGQPGLRVNVSAEEILRYAPRKADVIDFEKNAFETVELQALLSEHGQRIPLIQRLVSVREGDRLRKPSGLGPDFAKDRHVVTFEGLLSDTPFLAQIRALLRLLEERLGRPVDIEFASDGTHLYLLQCRPQSFAEHSLPSAIPRDIPHDRIVFTANRFVSNGQVPDVTHLVYVDPERYERLSDLEELKSVGRAVGKLNNLLPKHRFVLMGPGRWGSRGDIKLGVSVGYADICNASMLIEIARTRGRSVPEVSFGTHFFQDLVESRIRYLPLYPDDEDVLFNEPFLRGSHNVLEQLLPDHAHLSDVLRVIDVPQNTGGKIVRVLLNAELDEAVAVLTEPTAMREAGDARERGPEPNAEEHWRWRLRMAERIAARLHARRFGVKGFYVFGSTKNATAGPGSDLDVIVHFAGTDEQRAELATWLEGWSLALAETNYLRTGYSTERLLDVHFVTDDDLARQTSYAAKIGAVTDAARSLRLATEGEPTS